MTDAVEVSLPLVLYVHGKGGSADEAEHYKPLFPDCRVVGLDYTAETPWEAIPAFRDSLSSLTDGRLPVTLIANSIGAYFALLAFGPASGVRVDRAFLISPVVSMERLITDMMGWARVTEQELEAAGEIPTSFGETLSWDYLSWVRTHPVSWQNKTHILGGSEDSLVARDTWETFAAATGAELTIMPGGEHWFHTPEQMAFLDAWLTQARRRDPDRSKNEKVRFIL